MRIRFRFSKLGKIRFTSQRDVARMWERALRRAGLPVAYTGGFSPRPQLSFGLALPTGCESRAEYLEVVFDDHRPETADLGPASLPARLGGLLPEGIEVQEAAAVGAGAVSLQQSVTSCSWTMRVGGVSRDELADLASALWAADTVPIVRERKGRQEQDDLRPSVLALAVAEGPELPAVFGEPTPGPAVGLVAELATQPRGVRPVELLRGLDAVAGTTGRRTVGTPVIDRACRTQQWIEREGIREEPLGPGGDATVTERAAHPLGRAS
jgi:radical SAM-linked protein